MPFGRDFHLARAIAMVTVATVLLQGCAVAPSIGILGAYFPDWLFCIVAGVVLAVALFLILKRLQRDRLLGPPAIVYPTLVTFLALVAWLVFFHD